MSRTPERIEKDKLQNFLRRIGAYAYWPVPSGFGRQGVDCYVCIYGQFWALEVKAPGSKATARQQQTLDNVRAAKGGICAGTGDEIIGYLCNSLGLDVDVAS